MSDSDDFYYRRKPHASIVRRQNMKLEVRAASYTYEDQMHARDGTLPDERTAKGMEWHQTVLGVRNSRTVNRIVADLLECGDLMRLQDGRLTNAEVQRELAHRARRRANGGNGSGGTGSASGGGGPPAPRQLVLIDGGRGRPEHPQEHGDKPVDEPGTGDEPADVRPNHGQTTPESRPISVEKPNEINGRRPHHSRAIATQRVVVAIPFASPRAREGPRLGA